MKETIKTALMYLLKLILSPLKLFPIKNYIMFCTNSGAGYYCNPKYIYSYLIKIINLFGALKIQKSTNF